MKVAYSSDFHGSLLLVKQLKEFIEKEKPEVCVLCGDMLPTQFMPLDEAKTFFPNIDETQLEQVGVIKVEKVPQNASERAAAQLQAAEKVFDAIDSLPCKVLWIPGNHDLPKLSALKGFARSRCISEDRFDLSGFNFVGFPYIPRMIGETNYESSEDEMQARLSVLEDLIDEKTVLVTHAPPFGTGLGVLSDKKDVGSKRLADFIVSKKPKVLLCGHVHEGAGKATLGSTTCINTACPDMEKLNAGCIVL